MRITYNAPLVLTYTIICAIITGLDTTIGGGTWAAQNVAEAPGTISRNFFMVYSFGTPYMEAWNPLTYFRLFSHAMGHAGWGHMMGNFGYILLLGPILEEKYGSRTLFGMMFFTALITGILNAFLFPNPLLGASGIVFMLITLISYTNAQKGTIPLSFILAAVSYLGMEVYAAMFVKDNISHFGHLVGGVVGSIFAFVIANRGNNTAQK